MTDVFFFLFKPTKMLVNHFMLKCRNRQSLIKPEYIINNLINANLMIIEKTMIDKTSRAHSWYRRRRRQAVATEKAAAPAFYEALAIRKRDREVS